MWHLKTLWVILVATTFVAFVLAADGRSERCQPEQEVKRLVISSIKRGNSEVLHLAVGDILLEATSFEAIHKNGERSLVVSSGGKVVVTYEDEMFEAKAVRVPLIGGLLSETRRYGVELDGGEPPSQ